MSAAEQTITLLTEIRDTLRQIARQGAAPSGGGGAQSGDITAASDAQLDDPKFGDPVVKKDPKRWVGQSFAGRRMSQCSAEFLDSVAEFNAWRAEQTIKEGKDPKYARLDAARALGWAKRIRAGWQPPAGSDPSDFAAPDPDDFDRF